MKKTFLISLFLVFISQFTHPQVTNPYSTGDGDYLIITPDKYLTSILPFAEWKMQKGHKVRIATQTEVVYAGYQWLADNLPNNVYIGIDGYIKNAYDNWTVKPKFILLVGDVNSLPTHMIVYSSAIGGKIPADINYGCVNSLNDPDPAKFYGLYFPEIAVGRFSVRNTTELTNIVNNSISFEKNPIATNNNYFNKVVFSADPSETRFKEKSEYLRNLINTVVNGPITTTVYTGITNDLINAINSGSIILNHHGHGNSEYWTKTGGYVYFTILDIPNLQNTRMLPIVWSLSCNTGNLLNYNDCLAEKFLKNSNETGAVAVFAPSVLGTGDDLLLQERFYESLWPSISNPNYPTGITLPNYYIGNALIHAKIGVYEHQKRYYLNSNPPQTFPPSWYPLPWDGLCLAINSYNLFGDPALEIWTGVPNIFSNVQIIDMGTYIRVKPGVDSTKITVSSDFDYGKSFFQVREGGFSHDFYTNRLPVTITITKHNFRPYIKKSYQTIFVQFPKRNEIQLGAPSTTPSILDVLKNTAKTYASENGYDGVVKYYLSSTSGLVTWKPVNNNWQVTGSNSVQVIYNLSCYDYNLPISKISAEIEQEKNEILNVNDHQLLQNYPNPFNPSTKISWQSPISSWQILKVYDMLGNEVAELLNEYKDAGIYEVEFNGGNLPSGIYIYTLKSGSYFSSKKMLLIK